MRYVMRVHEFAKEANKTTAEVLAEAKDLGIDVDTASSGLTRSQVDALACALTDEDGSLRTIFVQKGVLRAHKPNFFMKLGRSLKAVFWPEGRLRKVVAIGSLLLLIAAFPVRVHFDRPVWTRGVDHHELWPWMYWGHSNVIQTEAEGYVPLASSLLIRER